MNDWKAELQKFTQELMPEPEMPCKNGRKILHLKEKIPQTSEEKARVRELAERRAAKKNKREKKRQMEREKRADEKAFKESLNLSIERDKRKYSRVDFALMRSQNAESRPYPEKPEEAKIGSIHAMGQLWNRFDLYKK